MLLTPNQSDNYNKSKRERAWLMAALLLILGLLIALFWQPKEKLPIPPVDAIVCDAETVDKTSFVSQDYQFGGLVYRNDEKARSGQYSIVFPEDNQAHYGFSITLGNVKAGEVYEVSVWSYGNETGIGKLAVKGSEASGISLESNTIIQQDEHKWGLQKIRVEIPFYNATDQLSAFVYSSGTGKVFFDDLAIQKVENWDVSAFQVRQLYLDVEDKPWRKIEQKREHALQNGLLQTDENDWVKARFSEGKDGDAINAKIRLKGDWLDHLKGEKWSFRVKLSNGQAWNGMNIFSLQTPQARYFLHEWLLHKFWTKEDVLTTRYDFVELIINGESKGIYAYEEHFAKQLVESQERREGPILKFNEDGFWASTARQFEHHGFIVNNGNYSGETLANAEISAFKENDLLANPVLAKQYQQGQLLLEQFKRGDVSPNLIFDLQLMAKYYAGCDLLNAYHGIVWHNQRFYYNPITSLLEPIGFDGFADRPSKRYHFLGEGAMQIEALENESVLAFLLQDQKFIALYIQALEQYSKPSFWHPFVASVEEEWKARLQWLQLEFPNYRPTFEEINAEVAFVRSKLLPFAETSLRANKTAKGGVLLQNTHTLPLMIKGYGENNKTPAKLLSEPLWLPAAPVRKLWSKLNQEGELNPFQDINFWDRQALLWQSTAKYTELDVPASTRYLFYQIPGWDSVFVSPIKHFAASKGTSISQKYQRISRPSDFSTLEWQSDSSTIFIPKGKHVFEQDLIIAKHQRLLIEEGAEVDLQKQAAIISYGAVRAIGQQEQSIIIQSTDHTGQGLQVIQSKEASVLRKIVFKGLRNLSKGDWQLSGAVTFYESGVKIVDCRFLDNQSEDGLNIIRSRFEMDHCWFQNTSSDGFDGDFCKGIVSNSTFVQTTNDGMDFSGSVITIENCQLSQCGDKGISVGEASDVTVLNSKIEQSLIGMASKDESVLYAKNLVLTNCEQGLVAFQKKPEFGPATIIVDGLSTENVKRLYQKGDGSRLQIIE